MLAMLMDAHDAGRLTFVNTQAGLADKRTFKRCIGALRNIKWAVYCKAPFAGPQQVLSYLSRSSPSRRSVHRPVHRPCNGVCRHGVATVHRPYIGRCAPRGYRRALSSGHRGSYVVAPRRAGAWPPELSDRATLLRPNQTFRDDGNDANDLKPTFPECVQAKATSMKLD